MQVWHYESHPSDIKNLTRLTLGISPRLTLTILLRLNIWILGPFYFPLLYAVQTGLSSDISSNTAPGS